MWIYQSSNIELRPVYVFVRWFFTMYYILKAIYEHANYYILKIHIYCKQNWIIVKKPTYTVTQLMFFPLSNITGQFNSVYTNVKTNDTIFFSKLHVDRIEKTNLRQHHVKLTCFMVLCILKY